MRKISGFIIILNSLAVLALSVFFVYTLIRINLQSEIEYNLSDGYVKVNVYNTRPNDTEKSRELLHQIYNVIKNEEITILFDTIDSLGLAVYDSSKLYENQKLVEGRNLVYAYDNTNEIDIIVKKESFLYYRSNNTEKIFSLNNQTMKVVGVYSEEYPLFLENKEYVYNYLNASNLNGVYYIDCKKRVIIEEFLEKMGDNGYTVTMIRDGLPTTIREKIGQLFSDKSYLGSSIGIVFIYLNYLIFYKMSVTKLEKVFYIHQLFGGNKFQLLKRCLNDMIKKSIIGAFIGSLCYYVLFFESRLNLPLRILPVIWIVHLLISISIVIIVVTSGKMYIGGERCGQNPFKCKKRHK